MADRLDILGDKLIAAMIEKVAPRVAALVRSEVERIKRDAVAGWPVGRERGRPHSRDMFETTLVLEVDGNRYAVVGAVRNRATNKEGEAYWRFIKANNLYGKSAIVELVRKPMSKARDRIELLLATEIPEVLGE